MRTTRFLAIALFFPRFIAFFFAALRFIFAFAFFAAVGSKRYKQLKKAAKLYKAGKKKQAFAMREKMEKRIRDARKKKKR